MRNFLLVLLLIVHLPLMAAYSLMGDSVKITDLTKNKQPNYYITVFAHTNSANYQVFFDVWPNKAYIAGSFSAKEETIDYYYCGLNKSNGYQYFCEDTSKIELTITKINDDTCALTATIQAARNSVSYTYEIATFRFPYQAGGEPEDPTLDPYRFEPKDSTSFTFTGDVVSVRDRREDLHAIEITLNAIGDSTYNWVELNLIADTFAMPVGTYTFSKDSVFNTFLASPGYTNKDDQPSYVAIRPDKEEWGQYTPYYIVDGSVTFSLNEKGDSVYVSGQVLSKHGSVITIDVASYNMFYTAPEEPEYVTLDIDTVAISYLREQADPLAGIFPYTFVFEHNEDFPQVILDVLLPSPMALTAGTYTLGNQQLSGILLFQDQLDFTNYLLYGQTYIWDSVTLTISQLDANQWQFDMVLTDNIGSEYTFTLVDTPTIINYPVPTGLSDCSAQPSRVTKVMHNGQIEIWWGQQHYSIIGTKIK